MSNKHRMEAHFTRVFHLFNDATLEQKQSVYELASIILQQDDRLHAVGAALGADQVDGQADIVMEFMARAAMKHDDLAVIEFNASDYNVKHGFDGCPVDLKGITGNQCTDIFNLLEIQPVPGGADYAFWNVYEPATVGGDDEIVMVMAPGDRLLIDKNDGRMVMVRHYTNAPELDNVAQATYLFAADTCEKVKAIMDK